jgi:hypothetical protein
MADVAATATNLPLEGKGLRSASWWGMLCLIAPEAFLFVYLCEVGRFCHIAVQACDSTKQSRSATPRDISMKKLAVSASPQIVR